MRESGRMKFSCPASTLSCSSIVFYDWRIHEKLDDTLHMQLGIASLWINSDVHVIHTISVDMFVYALDLVCKRCFGKFIFQIHHVSRPKNFRTNEKSIELCVCASVSGFTSGNSIHRGVELNTNNSIRQKIEIQFYFRATHTHKRTKIWCGQKNANSKT